MENLNAEQVKKALECCTNGSCGTECPYYEYEPCQTVLDEDALSLIKELTEENERLHASCTELTQNLHECKADTVKEMHSMLCEGRVSNDNVVIVANQVAKEMLEGNI